MNIVFDFGNVLVRWEPEKVYSEFFGDEAKSWYFLRHIFTAEWRGRIDAGESQDRCIRQLKAQFPEYENAIEIFRTRWEDMLTGEMPGMRELILELRSRKYEIYGLTNWSMETFPAARERFSILQMIDRYVVSGAEGLIKPDPRLFQVLLDRYNLKTEETVFVDDNPDNVEAAARLGMRAIQFISTDDLRRKLEI